jgi:hypothetical protein
LVPHLAGLARADLSGIEGSDPDLASDGMWVTRRFLEFHLERRLVSMASLDQ